MSMSLVLLNYKVHAKFTFASYDLVFFIAKEKTGSSLALHDPLISCIVGIDLVEVGITSWRSPM